MLNARTAVVAIVACALMGCILMARQVDDSEPTLSLEQVGAKTFLNPDHSEQDTLRTRIARLKKAVMRLKDGQKNFMMKIEGPPKSTYKIEQGPPGLKGFRGPRGATGAPGPNGRHGRRGLPGRRGLTGPQGHEGPQGHPGARGPRGMQGKHGGVGNPGAAGNRGPQGPMGRPGKAGPRGFQGPKGLRGQDGEEGAPGAAAMAQPGPPGPAGPPGPIGNRGPPGTNGPAGNRGATGAQGNAGPRGFTGARGRRGGRGRSIFRSVPRVMALTDPITTYREGRGPADGRDNGFISGRTLNFRKHAADSSLRLRYVDNLRVYAHGGGHACRWNIYIDGRACSSGNIGGDVYVWGAANNHRPREILGYCRGVSAGNHRMQVRVQHTPGYGGDCYTGWYSEQTGWLMEVTEVPPSGVSDVFYKTGRGPADGRDHGFISGRRLSFWKKFANSDIRLTYYDNLRVYAHGGGHACKWNIYVDGRPCPTGNVAGVAYIWGAKNNHRPRTITGYCRGLSVGRHVAKVFVDHPPHYGGDCYTGWYSQQTGWLLEAREVKRNEDTAFMIGHGGDGRNHGFVNGRVLNFRKKKASTAVRLTYYDNLRVYAHGGGHACRWNIYVDGRPCPSGNIGGDTYIWGARNTHRPRNLVGYCNGLSAGNHRVQIKVQNTPGYGGDCYTGWQTHDRRISGYMIEAVEIPQGGLRTW